MTFVYLGTFVPRWAYGDEVPLLHDALFFNEVTKEEAC